MSDRLRQFGQYVFFLLLAVLFTSPIALVVVGLLYEETALTVLAVVLAAALGALLLRTPHIIMARANTVVERGPYVVSEKARAFHDSLLVCDLHSDTFMWMRDPLIRSAAGHIDLPRLEEGGAAVQVFAAATSCPMGMNFSSTPRSLDMLTPLVILQGWPSPTWSSLLQRACHMAGRMHDAAKRSDGRFEMILWRDELARFLARRHGGERVVAGVAAIEGAHCLEYKLHYLDILFDAGFRMMGLTHFFDNETSGSAHGVRKGGLTDLGRGVVRRMEELGMIIDLTHASEASMDETLERATRPLVISHTGPYGMHPSARNVRDHHLRAVAETGGVVGMGFWKDAMGRAGSDAVVDGLCYTLDLLGDDHVCLGSDWDGFTPAALDASGLPVYTEKLLARGLSEACVSKIMGGNILRVLEECLPERPTSPPPA